MDYEHFSGIFDDDGNRIDPNSIPKPNLCVTCKKNNVDDVFEDVLCSLTRFDQRNDDEFICHAYVPEFD